MCSCMSNNFKLCQLLTGPKEKQLQFLNTMLYHGIQNILIFGVIFFYIIFVIP